MIYFIFSVLVIANARLPILKDRCAHLIKIAVDDEFLTDDHRAIMITERGREDLNPQNTLPIDSGMISMKTTVIVILNVIVEELVDANSIHNKNC